MKIHLLNKMLNISKKEWTRIAQPWFLNLFLRIGFVMGWTVTMTLFIQKMGIEMLPFLLVLNALFIMLGTIIYSYLLKWIKPPLLMIYTTLLAGSILFTATLFVYANTLLFFGMILIAQSMLLSQLHILVALFAENLFSPLESQRTFPVIASAETFGGLIGGLTIGIFAGSLAPYKFIYLWIITLFLIIPTLLIFRSSTKNVPSLSKKHDKRPETKDIAKNMVNTWGKMKKVPFLKGMILMILMQFMLINLFEFQYIKAIQKSVIEEHTDILKFEEYEINTTLEVSLIDVTRNKEIQEQREEQIESEITRSLGIVHVIFSGGSLIVQMILASRLISNLGIMNSLALHPIISLLSLLGMAFNFNFFTTAVGRSSFEITGSIFNNAYHSSYYAIPEKIRSQVKEFLEGFVKPNGAILGFIIIVAIQKGIGVAEENYGISIIMMILALCMLWTILRLKKNYTLLSEKNLSAENDLPNRLNAIEILAQKGHQIDIKEIVKHLKNKKEDEKIKIKLLETLGLRQEMKALSEIIECLKLSSEKVQIAAIESLLKFKKLKQELHEYPFKRYHLIKEAQEIFENGNSQELRFGIVQLLAKIDEGDLIPFILKIMKRSDEKIQKACIRACGQFKDEAIIHYIKPYLETKNPILKGEAIAALWPFENLRKELEHHLNQMKTSRKKTAIIASLNALGEIGIKKDLPYLMEKLKSEDEEIQYKASKALAHLNHPESIPFIVKFLMHENKNYVDRAQKILKRLDQNIVESIEQLTHIRVSEYIHDILNQVDVNDWSDLDIATLEKLKNAYAAVDEYEEVFKIEKILNIKKNLCLTLKAHALAA